MTSLWRNVAGTGVTRRWKWASPREGWEDIKGPGEALSRHWEGHGIASVATFETRQPESGYEWTLGGLRVRWTYGMNYLVSLKLSTQGTQGKAEKLFQMEGDWGDRATKHKVRFWNRSWSNPCPQETFMGELMECEWDFWIGWEICINVNFLIGRNHFNVRNHLYVGRATPWSI